MFAPSNAIPTGLGPAGNSVGTVFALYHFSNATFSGFDNGGAPFPVSGVGSPTACCAWLTNKFAIARIRTITQTPTTMRIFMVFYSPGCDAVKLRILRRKRYDVESRQDQAWIHGTRITGQTHCRSLPRPSQVNCQ